MSEIIVLGLIPGTHIQITFLLWLVGILAAGVYLALHLERRKKLLRNWLIIASLLVVTKLPARV